MFGKKHRYMSDEQYKHFLAEIRLTVSRDIWNPIDDKMATILVRISDVEEKLAKLDNMQLLEDRKSILTHDAMVERKNHIDNELIVLNKAIQSTTDVNLRVSYTRRLKELAIELNNINNLVVSQ